ncbi:MAG TPA: PQQ-dependent sugar dehydrogenase [Flavisolibacter sp.]|jgi:glucose/arabinose dehydrogenase|nr:PQQ-dependent sugar dehydrogenase [Flavisolibacter sp.]
MPKIYFSAKALLLALCVSLVTTAQPPTVSYSSFITGLTAPIYMTNAGDGSNRLFIVERAGTIKVWNSGTVTTFINLGAGGENIVNTAGEGGLLSVAFHPDFDGVTNRYFFVYLVNAAGSIEIRRYQSTLGNSNTGDVSTGATVLTIPHPTYTNHYGGTLKFGPDGYLYLATGDGGNFDDKPANNAQNGNVLLGKIVRIDIDNYTAPALYSVPADNPYVSDPAVDDRIWALGLRNPFRWNFDKETGDMWIGDVGQGVFEEVDFQPVTSTGGINYGWVCYEGTQQNLNASPNCTLTNHTLPIYTYNNSGGSSITGGTVYRGSEYAGFRGYYIAADYSSGRNYFIWPNGAGGWNNASQANAINNISSFGEAEDGTLYVTRLTNGTVYKVVATGGTVLPVNLTSFTARHFAAYNELKWTTSYEEGTSHFVVEYGTDGRSFQPAGQVPSAQKANGSDYSFRHSINQSGALYYRLAIHDKDGSVKYSSVVKVNAAEESTIQIYPTVIRNRELTLRLSQNTARVQLVNSTGSIVFDKTLKDISGTSILQLPNLAKGFYVVQVQAGNEVKKTKVTIE